MPPPIQLFMTTIASKPKLRQRQDYILRILQVKKIPYETFDLASDEKAKRLWKRKAPAANQDLPGILVGYAWPGTFAQFEEAVEYNELDIFLRRNDPWNADIDDESSFFGLQEKPTGIPGAYTPHQMTGQTPSFAPKGSVPTKAVREGEMDLGEHLSGFGLQGVKVTPDDIAELVRSLGLDDDLTKDLAGGGLDFSSSSSSKAAPAAPPAASASSSSSAGGAGAGVVASAGGLNLGKKKPTMEDGAGRSGLPGASTSASASASPSPLARTSAAATANLNIMKPKRESVQTFVSEADSSFDQYVDAQSRASGEYSTEGEGDEDEDEDGYGRRAGEEGLSEGGVSEEEEEGERDGGRGRGGDESDHSDPEPGMLPPSQPRLRPGFQVRRRTDDPLSASLSSPLLSPGAKSPITPTTPTLTVKSTSPIINSPKATSPITPTATAISLSPTTLPTDTKPTLPLSPNSPSTSITNALNIKEKEKADIERGLPPLSKGSSPLGTPLFEEGAMTPRVHVQGLRTGKGPSPFIPSTSTGGGSGGSGAGSSTSPSPSTGLGDEKANVKEKEKEGSSAAVGKAGGVGGKAGTGGIVGGVAAGGAKKKAPTRERVPSPSQGFEDP